MPAGEQSYISLRFSTLCYALSMLSLMPGFLPGSLRILYGFPPCGLRMFYTATFVYVYFVESHACHVGLQSYICLFFFSAVLRFFVEPHACRRTGLHFFTFFDAVLRPFYVKSHVWISAGQLTDFLRISALGLTDFLQGYICLGFFVVIMWQAQYFRSVSIE